MRSKENTGSKKTLAFRVLVVLLIVVAFILYFATGLNNILTFDYLKDQRESLIELVNNNYAASVIIYIVAYILIVTLSLPGAAIMTLGGGMVFGMSAVLMVLFAATFGATLAFWASRFVIGEWVQEKFEKPLAKFNKELDQNGANYIFSARLFPFTPFWLLNLISGVTKIPTSKYVIATAVGIIPGTIVFTYTGTQLGNIDTVQEIASPGVIGAFVFVAVFSLGTTLIKRQLDKRKAQKLKA